MELSVSLAGENEGRSEAEKDGGAYEQFASPIGKVYIPVDEVEIGAAPRIRYERHPWIEQFEFDDMVPKAPRRTGYGTKTPLQFVKSLSNIYANAYNECSDYGYQAGGQEEDFDAAGYFTQVSRHFASMAKDESKNKLYKLFCGFVENVWREGSEEMHDVAMNDMLTVIESDQAARDKFYKSITDEFKEYIAAYECGGK